MKPLLASTRHLFQSAFILKADSTRARMEPAAIIFASFMAAISSLFIYLLLRP